MNKENWITDIESVPERITSAKMPDDVLQRIKAIPFTLEKKLDTVPIRTVWIAAASIAVLIAVNLFVFANRSDVSTEEDLSDTYFNYTQHL